MLSGMYIDELISLIQQSDKAYIIRMLRTDSWYFFDMNTEYDPHPVVWTPHRSRAFWFPDEESVEEFKKDFITPRRVEILRIDKSKERR